MMGLKWDGMGQQHSCSLANSSECYARATQMMCRAYDGNGRYAFTYAREKCYTVTVGYVAEVLLDVM